MAMPWFRFYGEAIDDMKLKRIARDAGLPMATVLGIWTIILAMASNSPERGKLMISATTHATEDDIADLAGCNVSVTLQKLLCNGLVTACNGVLCVPAWDKRQYESDNSTKRVQKMREKEKNAQKQPTVTPVKRYSNVSVTPPDTDTDTDKVLAADASPTSPSKPKRPKQTTAQQEMFGAVADTCELDPALKGKQIGKTAATLLDAGYTPEQVKGFKEWWQSDNWRLEHTPVPTISKLTDMLSQFKNARPVINGNGKVEGFNMAEMLGD